MKLFSSYIYVFAFKFFTSPSVTLFLRGAPPTKKNPESAPDYPYASPFHAHTLESRFQAAPLTSPCLFHQDHRQQQERDARDCRRILITSWPSRKNVKKCCGCRNNFSEKFRQPSHSIVINHFERRVVRRDECTGALVHSEDLVNTYYHPSPVHIMRKKKPAFDGRVHIDLGTYHSLDEGQRENMKVFGLIVNIV